MLTRALSLNAKSVGFCENSTGEERWRRKKQYPELAVHEQPPSHTLRSAFYILQQLLIGEQIKRLHFSPPSLLNP